MYVNIHPQRESKTWDPPRFLLFAPLSLSVRGSGTKVVYETKGVCHVWGDEAPTVPKSARHDGARRASVRRQHGMRQLPSTVRLIALHVLLACLPLHAMQQIEVD